MTIKLHIVATGRVAPYGINETVETRKATTAEGVRRVLTAAHKSGHQVMASEIDAAKCAVLRHGVTVPAMSGMVRILAAC